MKFVEKLKLRASQIKKITVVSFYLISGFIIMILKRDDINPIYKGVKYFLEHESYRQALGILKADPNFSELIRTRYHEFYKVPWNELRIMPAGTLGREFDGLMNKPGAPLDPLPPPKGQIDPETDYIRRRVRLIHDIHHVLTGFPNDELGEMGISAFYVAQIMSPLNSMLLAVGLIKCTVKHPTRMHELLETIIEGFQMGKNADLLFGQKWEDEWATSVMTLRERHNIKPSVRDFVDQNSTTSVGLTLNRDSLRSERSALTEGTVS